MTDASIEDAVERLASSKQRDRREGLQELKRILGANRRSQKQLELRDRGYHAIFEALFRLASNEKANYLRYSKGGRNHAATALSDCAAVFRLAVDVGVRELRTKTLRAVLDHITAVLPEDDGFCEPLTIDYLRAFRTILQYAPHPSHLADQQWQHLIEFCHSGISKHVQETDESESFSIVLPPRSSRRSDRISRASSPSSFSGTVTPTTKSFLGKEPRIPVAHTNHIVNDLVACLYYLLRVPHAPIMSVGKTSLDILHEFLGNSTQLSFPQGQEKAFASINVILTVAQTEGLELACSAFERSISSISRLWHVKAHETLKEQMLTTMVLGLPLLERVKESVMDDLEPLLETLMADYCRRQERDMLQLDDLDLVQTDLQQNEVFSFGTFRVRTGSGRAEQAGAILMIISTLLNHTSQTLASAERGHLLELGDQDAFPRKRQKRTDPLENFVDSITQHVGQDQLARVQILTFLPSHVMFPQGLLKICLDKIHALVSAESSLVSAWAMCAVASFAGQGHLNPHALISVEWLQLWNLGVRNLGNVSKSRAACHMMTSMIDSNVVEQKQINDTCDTLLASVEFNGPIGLSECSLRLWARVVAFKAKHSPSSIAQTSESVLRWLHLRWKPSRSIFNPVDPSQRRLAGPEAIIHMLSLLTGSQPLGSPCESLPGMSTIAVGQMRTLRHRPLTDFLLLRPISAENTKAAAPAQDQASTIVLTETQLHRLIGLAAEFLIGEVTYTIEVLQMESGGLRTVTADHIFSLTTLCMACFWVSTLEESRPGQTNRLQSQAVQLRAEISKLILEDTGSSMIWNGLLDSLGPLAQLSQTDRQLSTTLQLMAQDFDNTFWSSIQGHTSNTNTSMELAELDEGENSQSNSQNRGGESGLMLDWMGCFESCRSRRTQLSLRIRYWSFRGETASEVADAPLQILEALLQREPTDFMFCRPFLQELYQACNTSDLNERAERLLSYLGEEMLQSYEHERNEVAMGTCLDALSHFVPFWTIAENGDAADLALQVYQWFVTIALGKKIASPHVHECMAHLLRKVIVSDLDYAKDLSLPSPRTILLNILEGGQVHVKYNVGITISDIFSSFVLGEHDTILEDVLESLHMDVDWLEGTAIRMLILSHLGSRWRNLVRRCLFALVEAPYLVPAIATFSQRSIQNLATALCLGTSAELFRLFASQITYSWLESRPLTALPYTTFEYLDLKSMIQDAQHEITAQVLMRGRDEDVRNLSTILSTPYKSLLKTAFGKAAAYAIARDAAIRPEDDPQAAEAVGRLRQSVGKESFGSLLVEKFPEIIASMFNIVDRDDSVVKGFKRYKIHDAARSAYDEIISTCSSSLGMATSQQPSFKASFLADELDYICRRTGYDVGQIWTPALYCFVFRNLIRSIHPALGPLQGVTVIRRIRILVSMARKIVLDDYPLKMTLHALRPFIVDLYCCEDAVGIVRYLLTRVTSFSELRSPFLRGFIVASLVSLRPFIDRPQESTTQETHHRAATTSAKGFHSWLADFVGELDSSVDPGDSGQIGKELVTAARQVRGAGTAERGTPEGDLLRMILDDEVSDANIIIPAYRPVIINMLQDGFTLPSRPTDDILYKDQDALKHASAVWKSAQTASELGAYAKWACRIIGRAYSADGYICPTLNQEAWLDPTIRLKMRSSRYVTSESRFAILSILQDRLLSDDMEQIGAIEKALQVVAFKMEKDDSIRDCFGPMDPSFEQSLSWKPYQPPEETIEFHIPNISDALKHSATERLSQWAQRVSLSLIEHTQYDLFLSGLSHAIKQVEAIALDTFPFVVHLVLLNEYERSTSPKQALSLGTRDIFQDVREASIPHAKLMIELLLYLRTQQTPSEISIRERQYWVDIDYRAAAEAAVQCNKFKTALLFLELSLTDANEARSRRSSMSKTDVLPVQLLKNILRNLDDKDSYLGLEQAPNLKAYMDQSQFEQANFKSLSLLNAFRDSEILRHAHRDTAIEASLCQVLNKLDLNSLSDAVMSSIRAPDAEIQSIMFETARKLERWDVPSPSEILNPTSEVFRFFQDIYDESSLDRIRVSLNNGFANALSIMNQRHHSSAELRSVHQAFALLSEVEEVLSSEGFDELHQTWARMQKREEWMLRNSLDDSRNIISSRRTLFSVLSKSSNLRNVVKASASVARGIEARALLTTAAFVRRHEAFQVCLGISAELDDLVAPCKELGVKIDVASQFEASNVLWDQGEMGTSIRIVQHILEHADINAQEIQVHKSVLLARLGQRISEARLERPDEILQKYLRPAITALRGQSKGPEAGQVHHEFAAFCDQQLQNTDNIQDMHRAQQMRDRKEIEVKELDKMLKSSTQQGRERDNIKSLRNKAKQWFDIDQREFARLKQSRQELLKQSLENYLLSLQACDSYDTDALRFAALWLEESNNDEANKAAKLLSDVPSRKLAALMNQWTSRLLDSPSAFQQLLSDLIVRICGDHPYHAMYHVFASSKSKGGKDQTALSRYAAANNIAQKLKNSSRTASTWQAIHGSSYNFVKFAQEKPDDGSMRLGSRIALRASAAGQRLEQDAKKLKIPPPTLRLELRVDCDYSDVPILARFQSEFTLASGISMPKILTAIGSDGRKYKQLFKSGNDDLRQDSIMEQVFEQVSNLLKSQRETRQRNLGIRTYKVMPLTATAGIIEFVSNTIPLSDYLLPAHQKYYSNDLRNNACRKAIQEAQPRPNDVRIKAFQQVCAKFHPVLRYFFMERFELPDDWYARRLAYTRSTAAISMLGHILGLGDRHGHNILLDEHTGEVVHIDLGIAFEQGRVLPVPEVVPFRLTRDLVDGMGVTRTEGVFRRCCEFTLDALRKEAGSIMTILDVLRYDPLYSWSLSPLRLKRLQEDHQQAEELAAMPGQDPQQLPPQEKKDEQGEADRALTVVGKKLSTTLSVAATVNELIQQATDERNLALLYCGWAAYA